MRQASQLAAPTAAAGAAADSTLFTAAAATTTIVRNIHVANTAASSATFRIALGGSTATPANCIASDVAIAANSTADFYGPYVLPASGTIQIAASATTVTFTASGELSVAGG